MIPISKIGEKVGASVARKKAGARAFHAAYKKAPSKTLGTYVGEHKMGIAVNTALTVPDAIDIAHSRRSTHQGISSK